MAARAASAHPINRVGAAPRLDKVVEDILQHFDARLEAMDGGKGMIVCMSRRICVEVYTVEAEEVKDEVGFFTAVQAAIRKMDAGSRSGCQCWTYSPQKCCLNFPQFSAGFDLQGGMPP